MCRYAFARPLVVVSLVLTLACGKNPHDRAEAVIESAVQRLTVVHERLDELLSSVEERAVPGRCSAVRRRLTVFYSGDKPSELLSRLDRARSDYSPLRTRCAARLSVVSLKFRDARSIRDRLASEALAARALALRTRVASVSPAGLERVLDAASTDAAAWVALHQVNSSEDGRSVPDLDALESWLVVFPESLSVSLDELDQVIGQAQQKRVEYYALAGEPVPEP